VRVPAWLPRAAATAGERPALVDPEGEVTYAELLDRASHLRLEVSPGERVGIALPAGRAFVETLHACWLRGAVAVPLDLRLQPAERAAQAEGTALVVDAPLEAASATPDPSQTHDLDAVAAVVHTSGTTGEPRPVELTYGNFLWSALGSAVALGLDPGERWLCPLPLSHVGGLSIVVRSAIHGTTAVLHDRFDADAVAAAVPECTLVSLVPTMLSRVLDAGLREAGDLRCALIGGGPVPPALLERAVVPLAQTYGLTEACSQVTTERPAEADGRTAGPALPGLEVRITGPNGEVLGPGREGDIEVRGPTVMAGYLNRPEATSEALRDGWLRTRDMGMLDERGRLTVLSRRTDLIVRGGENLYPVEIETVIAAHPAVQEVAVVGVADARWGEVPVAFVVMRPGHPLPGELDAWCRRSLAGFKVPARFLALDALPRNAMGKVERTVLRQRATTA
jgi:o-succinylbenzoate---CoA ligase